MSVADQANIFIMSVACGVAAAFIYDLFRARRKALPVCGFLVHIEDLLYWVIIALMFFMLAYLSNDGEVRGFMFIGAALGALLYVLTLSRIVMKLLVAALTLLAAAVKLIFKGVKFILTFRQKRTLEKDAEIEV